MVILKATLLIIFFLMMMVLIADLPIKMLEQRKIKSSATLDALNETIETGNPSEVKLEETSPNFFGGIFASPDDYPIETTVRTELISAKSVGVWSEHVPGLISGQIDINDWNAGLYDQFVVTDPIYLRPLSIGKKPLPVLVGHSLADVDNAYIAVTKSDWSFPPSVVGFVAVSVSGGLITPVADPPIQNVMGTFLGSKHLSHLTADDIGMPGLTDEELEEVLRELDSFASDAGNFMDAVLAANATVNGGLIAPTAKVDLESSTIPGVK